MTKHDVERAFQAATEIAFETGCEGTEEFFDVACESFNRIFPEFLFTQKYIDDCGTIDVDITEKGN